ncbi:MAG: hypothetical protein AMXMBFR82_03060 [Candidatus Hydrogenedentota bacterium]
MFFLVVPNALGRQIMSGMKDKLEGLLTGKSGLMKGSDWMQKLDDLRRQRESGEFEIDKVVPGRVVGDDDLGFYLVQQDFPLDTLQGAIALGAVLDVCGDHIALSASDDELCEFDPRKALFIDTETSGLSGGTGTVAFLIGVGYFVDDVFRLDQCFMRDYDDEEHMLEYLGEVFKGKEAVVSYNGKSFDLPLLRTRFIQNRIPFRGDSFLHFDLLHAARRFWKRRLGACNLTNVERMVLGIERHGDVPGFEIPQLWFDYIRTRDARRLDGVFYHHKMDILSLVALTAWLSRCLSTTEGGGFEHAEDHLSLVRVLFLQKKYTEVVVRGERLLEIEEQGELRKECLEFIALAAKRLNDWQRMEDSYTLLLQENPTNLIARLELAKHYEHRARRLPDAERMCSEAVDYLETRATLGRATEFEAAPLAAFQKRLERIRRKLARGKGDLEPDL